MNTLNLDLEHCFGIKKLKHSFDFSQSNTQLIYASNGVMKTSFAETFIELSKGKTPTDRLFGKPTRSEVLVDGTVISKDFIHVVKSFESSINTSQSQTRLLVDQERKNEYDGIIADIAEQKRRLIVELNHTSGVKREDLEGTILKDFESNNIFEVLKGFLRSGETGLSYEVKYSEIINKDVLEFLNKPKVKSNIDKYFEKYTALLENSKAFKKGVFNPNQAENVSKTLQKENYFAADHKLRLNGVDEEFTNQDDLNKFFLKEREEILADQDLLSIEKEIKKVAVKNLQKVLEDNPIVSELKDIKSFKENLWYRYFNLEKLKIEFLIADYDKSEKRLSEIEEEAKSQSPVWQDVIDKFKQRFFVPFDVRIENKAESILGREVPNISFVFTDEESGAECTKKQNELEGAVLSQGERRAMYLMNVLFEIGARKSDAKNTLFIFDDVADSFDYKNKYAIVEYLRELTTEDGFHQIILTHNYDFYRTIQKRVVDSRYRRDVCFMAQKEAQAISMLSTGHNYQDDPFNTWKNDLSNIPQLISSIPFVRNLVDFSEGKSEDYKRLTALLHIKDATKEVKISELKEIFDKHIQSNRLEDLDQDKKVYELILEEANRLANNPIPNGLNLEYKIVLSIAGRLQAEGYMWQEVSDKSPINGDQAGRLLQRFKDEYGVSRNTQVKTLEKVNLITAENIHLNSFMFEPLIDLSINHLQELYKEVESNCPIAS
ncbi:MAG: hypothetical protein JJ909_02680 [Roseivirga sp.]|uniref:hypothetical protein n=1 Tax=Roseivirga sp. TaxID=1964215 RepID=UPI001B210D19|nr:hypothetical protein [Roseivirga sp.]MBO6659572.1 hypothetical protein [Roseivirga sp.]MBO6759865.1 hypothetical protein [Roseivirga sp.]MBO6907691.1 hypothetical protein [Roseivirga sp.]